VDALTDVLTRCAREAADRGASDLHLVCGLPPIAKVAGEMEVIPGPVTDREALAGAAAGLFPGRDLREAPCRALSLPGIGRFRVTGWLAGGNPQLSLRLVPSCPPTPGELGLPAALTRAARAGSGLVLLAGPAGSGRSSTMHALLSWLNDTKRWLIVSIEDPVECEHPSRQSAFVQLDLGADSPDLPTAISGALRHAPDCIAIGEMSDPVSSRAALEAAASGILVIACLYAHTAAQALARMIEAHRAGKQHSARELLADSLAAVFAQRLLPTICGSRTLAGELLLGTAPVRALIREGKLAQLATVVETSGAEGMQSLDSQVRALFEEDKISFSTALTHSTDRSALESLL